MKTSDATVRKIEEFEGCVLHAYKPVAAEQYYTIGYGHYGADVSATMTITKAEADTLFRKDLERFEEYVNTCGLALTQNQFDALVSFTYNCGPGCLQTLIKNRTHAQIAEAILLYNKDASGRTLAGLTRRRQWERELFLAGTVAAPTNPYAIPAGNVQMATDQVRWVQYQLNMKGYGLVVDGVWGKKTEEAVRAFQADRGLAVDGIVGPATKRELQK